ncbi:hypothetical protein MESS2_1030162 [Mesorhizobium metallidurans STM 2683]|uniref:Uncharacterized protein n=1 Tax=Mesorhizobium metallidurans STM 2683 TaxID=1297569 RepID=M5EGD5_9HYPH|nr:hypothetical protein MESS2_1030162 [Mesorhizobium metallidurans STM 2683]
MSPEPLSGHHNVSGYIPASFTIPTPTVWIAVYPRPSGIFQLSGASFTSCATSTTSPRLKKPFASGPAPCGTYWGT